MKTSEWKAIAKAQQVIIEKALERIAELEAELAFYRRLKDLQELKTRAEKAEAEVEERRRCRSCALCSHHVGVNPSGDTLGKERDDG